MRFALAWLLWATAAGAQVAEFVAKPAPPPVPPVVHQELAPPKSAKRGGDTVSAQTNLYSIGQPTNEEQYYLELINRARANPTAEGIRLAATTDPNVTGAYTQYGVNLVMMKSEFAALETRPPLAFNAFLIQAARGHSLNMLNMAFQGHNTNNQPDGATPGNRATAAGYNLTSLGENVYAYADSVFHGHAGFEVDWGPGGTGGMQPGRGHRVNIHGNYREVGIGVENGSNGPVGPQLVTQDFGTSNTGTAFVTGVAFYDLNANSFYDAGEGIGGLTVNVDGSTFHAITANSGGYAVPVPKDPANRAVTFTGPGLNGGGAAVIASENNAKVDLTPVYVPPTVSGSATASTVAATTYNFTTVGGAASYEWRRAISAAAAADAAENLSRVTVNKTGAYNVLSTAVKHAGTAGYQLAHTNPAVEQSITYNATFLVNSGGTLNFRSRLALAGSGQQAQVQVSTNNGQSWTTVYSQTGSGGVGEGSFNAKAVSLAAYEGKEIRLRYVYGVSTGGIFLHESNPGFAVGWFIDTVSFASMVEISDTVITAVPGGSAASSFDFTAPGVGAFSLSVRAMMTGGAFPFGPALAVTGVATPPAAEVSLQQPAGAQLTNGVSSINFGSANVGSPLVRTFTVANQGLETLTGLAVIIDGAHAGNFVASALGAVSLAGGQSTTFTVTFTPSAAGGRNAVLHLASNDTDENPFDVTLDGTGILEPNVTLQQPGGSNLTDGSAAVAFGTATLGVPVVRTFTVVNDGNANLTGLAPTVDGLNAAEFVAGNPGLTTLTPGQSTTFDVTFTPSMAGVRSAVLRLASNDADENPFDVTLSGTGSAQPVVSVPAPAAVMRQVGGAQVDFTVTAAPLPVTYQWRKNGAAIASATNAGLTILSPKVTDAGAYTVAVKRGALTTISGAAQLGVVDNTPKALVLASGGTAAMTVTTAGNNLTYKWRRIVGVNPPEDLPALARFKNVTTKSLSIGALIGGDSATYFCEVTGPGGQMVVGGTTNLRVFDSPPVITSFNPPNGIVGGTYNYSVVMNGAANLTPTAFSATNLPTGLKIDPKTGLISGKPTKAADFNITITASNSKGKMMMSKLVTIAILPPNLAGVFAGWVERQGINGNVGGRIDLTVTPTGSYTGTLAMGTVKYALIGALDIDVNGVVLPRTELFIKRTGTPLPEPLKLNLEFSGNAFTANSKVSAEGQEADITGWRQIWHATSSPATAYLGYYTAALPLAGVEGVAVPQGSGYGYFTVAKDGKLTVTGKTADGETISCAAFVGPAGQVAIFQVLYATLVKGSLLGQLQIGLGGNAADPIDNTVTGILDWNRPLGLASARTYKAGFGNGVTVALDAVGSRYVNGTLIMGLTAGTDNAKLVFSAGGLAAASRNPNVTFDVTALNKITIPVLGVENPAAAKLTVTPATGLFTGSFMLEDANPRTTLPVTPAIVKRTVTFQGLLVRDGVQQYGAGYFLMPQLPGNGPPATTPTTSAILSGKVILAPAP